MYYLSYVVPSFRLVGDWYISPRDDDMNEINSGELGVSRRADTEFHRRVHDKHVMDAYLAN